MKRLNWPMLGLLLSAFGALVRGWQMSSAFEGEQGLHIPGASASWAMIAFFALAAASFMLMARPPAASSLQARCHGGTGRLPRTGTAYIWR